MPYDPQFLSIWSKLSTDYVLLSFSCFIFDKAYFAKAIVLNGGLANICTVFKSIVGRAKCKVIGYRDI